MNRDLTHPDLDRLIAFDRGLLGEHEWPELDQHIANCPQCCQRLQELPEDQLTGLLRETSAADASKGAREGDSGQPSADSAGRLDLASLPAELARHERYCVVDYLGAGGMGTVYKARHKLMGRTVALKIINQEFLDRPGGAERFRREIRAAAGLDHPNIVRAYDAERLGNAEMLVMEYVHGKSVEQIVRERGPLPIGEACDYARQAAFGLEHAWQRGMVHRDIKPQNLLLDSTGRIRILDFGLAKLASENAAASGLTHTGLTVGTPDYLAPEQALDARRADIRADIYGLGCTLYFMLTGSPPCPEGTPIEKVLFHRDNSPTPLMAVRPDAPRGLLRVFEKMTEKTPERRYSTPAELARDLGEWATQDEAPGARTDNPNRRTNLAIRGFAAALALFVAAAALAYAAVAPQAPEHRAAPGPVAIVTRLPGASVRQIESTVTNPLERAICEAPGVLRTESRSISGQSIVQVYFRDDADAGLSLAALNTLVSNSLAELHQRPPRPIILPALPGNAAPLGLVRLESPEFDAGRLTELARSGVVSRLRAIPGVGLLPLLGATQGVTQVRFDAGKLDARGLCNLKAIRGLERQLRVAPLGTVQIGQSLYELSVADESTRPLERIPLPPLPHGPSGLLGDVATVEQHSPTQIDGRFLVNAAAAVCVAVYAAPGADEVELRSAVDKEMAEMRRRLPGKFSAKLFWFGAASEGGGREGLLAIELRLPSNTPLPTTEREAARVAEFLKQAVAEEEFEFLCAQIGPGPDAVAAASANSAACDATIWLQLSQEAKEKTADLAARLRDRFTETPEFSRISCRILEPATATFNLRVFGASLATARQAAESLRDRVLKSNPSYEVEIVERLDSAELLIVPDLRKCGDVGIAAADLAAAISAATRGGSAPLTNSQHGEVVEFAPIPLDSVQALSDIKLSIGGGGRDLIPLGNLAQLRRSSGLVEISHAGMERVINVHIDVPGGAKTAAIKSVQTVLTDANVPDGIRVEIEGALLEGQRNE